MTGSSWIPRVIIPRTIINSKSSLKSESEGKWMNNSSLEEKSGSKSGSEAKRMDDSSLKLESSAYWESWHAAKELKELFQKAASSYDAVRLGADLFYLRVHILYFSLHVHQILLIFPILSDLIHIGQALLLTRCRLVDMSKPGCRTVVVQSDLPLL